MALITLTSPHTKGANRTATMMRWVIAMTIPGLIAQTLFFGWGNLHNIIWCSIVAILCEVAVLKLRKRPIAFYLNDYSALVTAVLLGLALPPFAPWWVSLVATAFAIILAGLFGALLGPSWLSFINVNSPKAQGLAIGAASHALGTATISKVSYEHAAYSSLALIISAVITAIFSPLIINTLVHFL